VTVPSDFEKARRFYDQEYDKSQYASKVAPERHIFYSELTDFVNRYNLQDKKVLEIGCGRGTFQHLTEEYMSVDIAFAVHQYIKKPFMVCSAPELCFRNNEFDAIWTVTVLEHVQAPERALREIRRVLRPGGFLFLAPAWYCRPWAAQGYPVRRFSDLDFKGKLIKASIPIRESSLFRALYLFPQRILRRLTWLLEREPTAFRYRQIEPNYEKYWMSDSDAVNSMDPHEVILWFESRGDLCVSYPSSVSSLLVRSGPLVFQVRK